MLYPNIEAERARNGLSYEQMAKSLGVSRKTIYNWLNSGDIPQAKLEAMSTLFRCRIDYLLGRSEIIQPSLNDPVTKPCVYAMSMHEPHVSEQLK